MSAPHALIVGVGPGLGAALACEYARAGYDLTLIARSRQSLDPVVAQVAELGRQAWPVLADAADPAQIDAAVTAASEHGPVALLHHNASMHAGGLLAADPDTIAAAVAVCAISAVAAVQAALPDLRATASLPAEGATGEPVGGLVAWTGGGIALSPRPDYGVLAVGKAAMRAASVALAGELAEQGIRLRMLTVNGFIRPTGRMAPDRIAAASWAHTRSGEQVEALYPQP